MFEFESSGAPEESRKSLPEGKYMIAPVCFSLRDSRSGTKYLSIDYVVMAGEHAGASLFGQSVFFSEKALPRTQSLMQTMHSEDLRATCQADFFAGRFGRPFIGYLKLNASYRDEDKKILELDKWEQAKESHINEMRAEWNANTGIVKAIKEGVEARIKSNNEFALKHGFEQADFSKKTLTGAQLNAMPKYIQVLIPDAPLLAEEKPDVSFSADFDDGDEEDIPF